MALEQSALLDDLNMLQDQNLELFRDKVASKRQIDQLSKDNMQLKAKHSDLQNKWNALVTAVSPLLQNEAAGVDQAESNTINRTDVTEVDADDDNNISWSTLQAGEGHSNGLPVDAHPVAIVDGCVNVNSMNLENPEHHIDDRNVNASDHGLDVPLKNPVEAEMENNDGPPNNSQVEVLVEDDVEIIENNLQGRKCNANIEAVSTDETDEESECSNYNEPCVIVSDSESDQDEDNSCAAVAKTATGDPQSERDFNSNAVVNTDAGPEDSATEEQNESSNNAQTEELLEQTRGGSDS